MKQQKTTISAFSVLIIFSMLCIIGASLIPLLDIQFTPSRSLPSITVSYRWPDASAKVIEQEVTAPLEASLSRMRGLKSINSVSKKGSGEIEIEFKDEVDMDAARFEVATYIRQQYRNFPEQVTYPQISLGQTNNKSALITFTLNANAPPLYIQQVAEQKLKSKLALISGVNEVLVYGATPFEWEIKFQTEVVQQLGISGDEIASAINNYFKKENLGLGLIKGINTSDRKIRLELKTNVPDQIVWDRIPIKKVENRIIQLGDIAHVRYVEQAPSRYFRINGLNTINIVVYPEDHVNTIQLAEAVLEKMESLKQELPVGYSVITMYNTTEYLKKELEKISYRMLFSMLILLLFVWIASRKWQYLMLILLSLLANLLLSFILYWAFNLEIHLYSLAGITISFGIMIDNSIVMLDHLRHHGNKHAFLSILAATLTSIGAILIVFLLDEAQQINLLDFAYVIIINLSVSLLIAYFLIPSLFEKIPLKTKKNKTYFKRKKKILRFEKYYGNFIRFEKRFKWIGIIIFILSFGLPIYMLPEKLGEEGTVAQEQEKEEDFWTKTYNQVFGADWYNDEVREYADLVLGGSLRLFTEKVYNQSYYSEPGQTTLYIRGSMPEGCTVNQLNEAIEKMENFISKYDEIEKFQTSIYSYNSSSITITFTEEAVNSGFPFYLKAMVESKAISLGGLDWSVYGVGQGFSNSLSMGYRNSAIILTGYNYDQLYRYAETLRKELLVNPRIKEVDIEGDFSWQAKVLYEFGLDLNFQSFVAQEISPYQFHGFIKDATYRTSLGNIFNQNESQYVTLVSDKSGIFNVWDLNNAAIQIEDKSLKMSSFGKLEKTKTGNEIYKKDQQYQLVVAYDFIGPGEFASKVMKEHAEKTQEKLPLGYQAKRRSWYGWNKEDKSQYYLLFLAIVIIFFVCSIVFESLSQPFTVILLIPISFIGLFLTFYLFDLNFDQGGFAAFVLLSGIVVNSALFIINDFNNYRKKNLRYQNDYLRGYLRAFNSKIIPIILTTISTILGLIPFIWQGQNEVFWFSFAAGSIGGLVFSVIAVLVYLPLFLRLKT
ncbi:efflux RND transporter permease subunit [Chondrinema litorale]|uniref:efflux RND transporter permease subunit n=1 Tax=Chondrinema litorale TaxID=2994555 RepID=UPI0025433107|nr:efflux RND transporter permease subunit [Chondrinema litorale]UZR97353.1 efflux RND transporter permease subunit [Chondrinema litorale]